MQPVQSIYEEEGMEESKISTFNRSRFQPYDNEALRTEIGLKIEERRRRLQ